MEGIPLTVEESDQEPPLPVRIGREHPEEAAKLLVALVETHPPAVEEKTSAAFRLEVVMVVAITAGAVSSDRRLLAVVEETAPKAVETLSLVVAVKGKRKMVAEREEVVKEQVAKAEVVVVMEPKAVEVMEPKAVETAQAVVVVGTALDAVVVVVMEPKVVADVGTALDAVSYVVVDAVG